MSEDKPLSSSAYQHSQNSVQRPDVGVESQFSNKKARQTYRYDSSLAPELCWDENAERAFAEWLLQLIVAAAEQGEAAVFAAPQIWHGTGEQFKSLPHCAARLKRLTQPFLNWSGKAERQQLVIPTLPLFVHERHSTQAILETLRSHNTIKGTLDLFGDPQLDIADKLDAYAHVGPWTNRLVLGDSLQVMNSALEYEGMGGQVQMIYFDPPYGVKFGSNFQPFVRKRDVKHGADDDMSREPEMVKAYRDTWELGLHSYLTYLRDRLLLARELLTDSGSIFVQISDDNLHHVREVMDEIFGADNFITSIYFRKTSNSTDQFLSTSGDIIVWYGKNKEFSKFRDIFTEKSIENTSSDSFGCVEFEDGTWRRLTSEEKRTADALPKTWKLFGLADLTSSHYYDSPPFQYQGQIFYPKNRYWSTSPKGLLRLEKANRLAIVGTTLRYRRYFNDFSLKKIDNSWNDTGTGTQTSERLYVVQTSEKVIQRCLQMTTDPGDLVMDITCGSGTTAYVAEQWGRRWITCDTSRVPLALARQRLLTATFPWYELKTPTQGPAGGFIYERKQNRKGDEIGGLVPRITLKSIANNEPPELVTLVDRPEVNKKTTRVCGAFTVEATIQAAQSLIDEDALAPAVHSPRAYLDRMIEVLRHSKTLQLPGNLQLELTTVRALPECDYLHAEATAKSDDDLRIAIYFGPEDGAIGSEAVYSAHTEALQQGFQRLFLFGFAIQAKTRDLLEKLKVPTLYVTMTPDVVMSDLLKTSRSSEIFSVTGLPDITLQTVGNQADGMPLYQVEIKGLDIFLPDTLETEAINGEDLPCWMLDTNYNGMVFCASQVFFPKTGAWDNLQKSLKGSFADSVWEHLAGTISAPFALGDKKRIAVKVIDERGNELMVIKGIL